MLPWGQKPGLSCEVPWGSVGLGTVPCLCMVPSPLLPTPPLGKGGKAEELRWKHGGTHNPKAPDALSLAPQYTLCWCIDAAQSRSILDPSSLDRRAQLKCPGRSKWGSFPFLFSFEGWLNPSLKKFQLPTKNGITISALEEKETGKGGNVKNGSYSWLHFLTHTQLMFVLYLKSLFWKDRGKDSATGLLCKDWIQFSESVANFCESFPWNPTFGVDFP